MRSSPLLVLLALATCGTTSCTKTRIVERPVVQVRYECPLPAAPASAPPPRQRCPEGSDLEVCFDRAHAWLLHVYVTELVHWIEDVRHRYPKETQP